LVGEAGQPRPQPDVGREGGLGLQAGQVPDRVPGGPLVPAQQELAPTTTRLALPGTSGPDGGEAIVIGFDVAVADASGQIAAVYGFLDKVPAAA
jgi:hypothetical protein